MIHPRQPQTPATEHWPVDACDATSASPGRRARQPSDRDPRRADEFAGALAGPVPTWEEARRALFGADGRAGLIDRCRDDESLMVAARDCHPSLGVYCAHLGRDRLAYAPIHAEENDRGRRELEGLRQEYEALAAPWEERRERGHALEVRSGDLRKPNFAGMARDRRP